jgi:hypothetical protein
VPVLVIGGSSQLIRSTGIVLVQAAPDPQQSGASRIIVPAAIGTSVDDLQVATAWDVRRPSSPASPVVPADLNVLTSFNSPVTGFTPGGSAEMRLSIGPSIGCS